MIGLLGLCSFALLAWAVVPSWWSDGHHRSVRKIVTTLAALQCVSASVGLICWLVTNRTAIDSIWWQSTQTPLSIGFRYDGVSGLMFTLVSFVGWIICRHSVRYLDGEVRQGRYFRWTAVTLGAVSLMVLSGNLLMFILMWVSTSLGLHQLLMHYGDRPGASRAAWTKFTISRVGDAALIAAMVLLFRSVGSLDFGAIFAAMPATSEGSPMITAAGWLLMVGAVTKSAQFPTHIWLPQTMETPTPVSALMHAGIVNAGGYLIVRTSPIVSLVPSAMTALILAGGITAIYASLVMLTQTSVKRSLAYSTIAQMGFMLLQCGLGAFSAAMLHIVAHSLYKAHAFLGSGSILKTEARSADALEPTQKVGWATMVTAFALCVVTYFGMAVIAGVSPTEKPSGFLLGMVIVLAVAHWLLESIRMGSAWFTSRASLIGLLLMIGYLASYRLIDFVVAGDVGALAITGSMWAATGIVLVGFGALFAFHRLLASETRPRWLINLHVHASNGFYLEALVRRFFNPLASS
ncbi:MAG: proton-conducting transporter membrane subunit [Planctomycetota bacterium]